MKIVIAKTSGFCMGVRRAVELVLEAPGKHSKPIYTYGPLIHNPQVLDLLNEKGIKTLNDIPHDLTGTVLIRAHGVPPETKNRLKKNGLKVIDATCPRVIKVQTIIRKHARKGYASIIIGDGDHPEVIGLLGFAGSSGTVVSSIEALDALPAFEKAIIVAQTTQNTAFFEQIKQWAGAKYPHYKIFDTICDSTAKRQTEVKNFADAVDAVVVVGGYDSGNTRRLAEIAGQTGKPVFHIESETDLDTKALATAQTIGLTAGASTPNWITKRVYRALEMLPIKKAHGWRRMLFNAQRALLLTNIFVSLGAGSLCYACTSLLNITHYFPHMLIAMLYIQSMHILNNLTGTKADRYNDPDRALFYYRHRFFLALLAVIGGGVGLITAYTLGRLPFSFLLTMSLMGLSYNIKILPKWVARGKYRRLRDIPGSKSVLIALAWGVVTTILPTLSVADGIGLSTLLVFVWVTGLVFVRTTFFDILDAQGDRIVGQGTIPTLLGETRTLKLLQSILVGMVVLLFLSAAANLISSLGIALTICAVILGIVMAAHDRGYMHPGFRLEFLVETLFVAAGPITLIWSVLTGALA